MIWIKEDVAELEASTGLSASQIQQWAINVDKGYSTGAAKERFFSANQVIYKMHIYRSVAT